VSFGIRPFQAADTEAVIALWRECGLARPWNDPHRDIARKLTVQPELFLVAVDAQGLVIGTAMAGYEGHRGWLNYLAVAPRVRRQGLGRTLVERVEQLFTERGCPKINLLVRSSNEAVIAFYRRMGYAPDDAVPLGKRLIPDN
jgi:ribosomal protein S18 acetylase RimI-like enzyme